MKKTFNPEITAIINDDLAEGIYMQNSGWVLDSPFYATQGLGNANNHNAAIGCTYGHPRSEGVTDGNTHGDDGSEESDYSQLDESIPVIFLSCSHSCLGFLHSFCCKL